MHVELYDPDVPIDNKQLPLLKRMLDPLEYSVDECEDVYLAVRLIIKYFYIHALISIFIFSTSRIHKDV